MANDSRRKRKRMLLRYVIALCMLSISFPFMPLAVRIQEQTMALLYISAALLWIGGIGTAVTAIKISRVRRKNAAFREQYPELKRLGLTHFFQNRPAARVDAAFAVSLLALVAAAVWGDQTAIFICIAFAVFTFGLHCMLNGVNYVFINFRQKRGKMSCVPVSKTDALQ